jgi:rhodanese-related sulfurtransferase
MDFFKTPDGLEELTEEKFKETQSMNPIVIDVRSSMEYNRDHIPNSIHIPLRQIKKHLHELPKEHKYILVCATGHRSRAAGAIFLRNGYKNVSHLKGGIGTWKNSESRIVK